MLNSIKRGLNQMKDLSIEEIRLSLARHALNNCTDAKEMHNDFLVIKGFAELNQCSEFSDSDWTHQRLLYQCRRYLSGMRRSKQRKPTRYFLCTQMKSATKHLEKCLANVYGLQRFTPPCDFHDVAQSPSRIKPLFFAETDFIYGDAFVSYHLFPSESLISHARQLASTIFVLLRNPAQATVSHYYYCLKNDLETKDTFKPGEYYGPTKIDDEKCLRRHLINTTLPRACEFAGAWLDCRDIYNKNHELIRILFHEELVENKQLFYEKLDAGLAIGRRDNSESLDIKKFDALVNQNMRSGRTDEWKEFFDQEEIKTIIKLMSPLLNRHEELVDLWGMNDFS